MVHELQKERGMTSGFLASKGLKFAEFQNLKKWPGDRPLLSRVDCH